MRLISVVSLLLVSTAAFGANLNALPEVDPEINQPGMEMPVPRGTPPRGVPNRAPPPVQAVPVPQAVPVQAVPMTRQDIEIARTRQLYQGYRGPTPYYTPYYTPPPYAYAPPPPPGYYGQPPVDPGQVILGIIANQVLPAIIYNINRRRY